jgi:hypothetical protein
MCLVRNGTKVKSKMSMVLYVVCESFFFNDIRISNIPLGTRHIYFLHFYRKAKPKPPSPACYIRNLDIL